MDEEREVLFNEYCKYCIHYNKPESEKPCDECLDCPVNIDTAKPVKFKSSTERISNIKQKIIERPMET